MQQIEERVLNYTLGPKFNDSYFTVFFFSLLKNQQQITFGVLKMDVNMMLKRMRGSIGE